MSAPTEARLREALDAYAEQVSSAPDAYARARSAWRRRERRRRILVIVVAVLVVAAADAVGLWALNRAGSGSPVVFDGPAPARLSAPGHDFPARSPGRSTTMPILEIPSTPSTPDQPVVPQEPVVPADPTPGPEAPDTPTGPDAPVQPVDPGTADPVGPEVTPPNEGAPGHHPE